MNLILEYFPDLTDTQIKQLEQLDALYREWNAQINVISRKDIDNLYTHHVLHSMSLAAIIRFKPGSKILDLGTGGGFPGIPLAILFPKTQFWLVDSVGKKLKVVQAVADAIGLKNIIVKHTRVEKIKQRFDFVVTRAVAKLPQLMKWTKRVYSQKHQHGLPNGLFAFKGTNNAAKETEALGEDEYTEVYPLADLMTEDYFQTKALVYVQGY